MLNNMKYFKAKSGTSKLLHAQLTLAKQKAGEHQMFKNQEYIHNKVLRQSFARVQYISNLISTKFNPSSSTKQPRTFWIETWNGL